MREVSPQHLTVCPRMNDRGRMSALFLARRVMAPLVLLGMLSGWSVAAAAAADPAVAFHAADGVGLLTPHAVASSGITATAPTPSGEGFWTVTGNGTVTTTGDATSYGDASNINLRAPIVSIAPTADGNGYWLLGSDGGVFSFGDASFFGSTGSMNLNSPALQMVATADSHGYWFVAGDGGIFAFGDAQFYGSMGGKHLNLPVVGMAATSSGIGYWLVASDGGIFSFGDAPFHGSTGSLHLNQPVVGMTSDWSGGGYWLVATDGGLFAFGDVGFFGSAVGRAPAGSVVSMVATSDALGYWIFGNNGNIYAFGDAATTGGGDLLAAQNPVQIDPNNSEYYFFAGQYTANATSYQHAIEMAPGAIFGFCNQNDNGVVWADFNLNRAWNHLGGSVALKDSDAANTVMDWAVYVDGNLKASGTVHLGQTQQFNVPVANALRARLWVHDPNTLTDGTSVGCDSPYLVWGDPTLSHH